MTETVRQNLQEIKGYIWRELNNPVAAEMMIQGIRQKIYSLRIFPQRQPLLDDKINKNNGLRMLPYKNYNIFYYYDMEADVVYIIRILYGKSDWKLKMK